MSFLDYLKDHRGDYLDHRAIAPTYAAPSALEAEEAQLDAEGARSGIGNGATRVARRRRPRTERAGVRYRHIQPAFAPSPYSDPLPYEAPWERAFR